jgi:hypothetical protein
MGRRRQSKEEAPANDDDERAPLEDAPSGLEGAFVPVAAEGAAHDARAASETARATRRVPAATERTETIGALVTSPTA